jgi:hypothetical protein
MRRSIAILATTLAALTLAVSAFAQSETRRAPAPGMTGVGFGISAAIPNDDAVKNGPRLVLSGEHYLTSRISIRGALSGAWLDVHGRPFPATMRPISAVGTAVYNWEGGVFHPFVSGGTGVYHYRFTEDGVNSSNTKIGLNIGGGGEWFVGRRDSLTGELQYHVIPDRVTSALSSYEPTFWTVSFGYKRYF